MPIQILLIIVILILIWRLILRFRKKDLRIGEFILWLIFWLVAIIVILLPKTIDFLARTLKVGRGADLVIYLALIIIFYIVFRISIHLEKTERKISKIVEKIALKDKE